MSWRKKPGRPTKRTPDVMRRLCAALRAGNPRRVACASAGISEDSFAKWSKNFPDFSDSIKKAEADAITRNVAIIRKAAQKTWQAAAWWLERRYPDDWGRKERHELTGGDGGLIGVDLAAVAAKLDRKLERLAQRVRPPDSPGSGTLSPEALP